MTSRMPTARPTIRQSGFRAEEHHVELGGGAGTGAVPETPDGSAIAVTALAARTKIAFRRATGAWSSTFGTTYIPVHLKVHNRGLAVLELVQGWEFRRVGLDVCELTVMPDGSDQEGRWYFETE